MWILLYLVTFDFKTLKPFGIFCKYSPTAPLTYNVVTYHPNNSIPDVIPFTIAARVLRTVDLKAYSQLTNLEKVSNSYPATSYIKKTKFIEVQFDPVNTPSKIHKGSEKSTSLTYS